MKHARYKTITGSFLKEAALQLRKKKSAKICGKLKQFNKSQWVKKAELNPKPVVSLLIVNNNLTKEDFISTHPAWQIYCTLTQLDTR